MQKLCKPFHLIFLFIFCACHGNKETKHLAPVKSETAADVQSFFPVTEFLLGQIQQISSLPVTPLKITNHGNKKDSVWLKRSDIQSFTIPFLHPVIDSASMQKYFSEKSFLDQTINAITLTYDPKVRLPDSIKLNHWDVYIDPQKNNVRRIYMVKEDDENGQPVTTQLTWLAGKWCSIRTIRQEPKKDPDVKEEILKWDFDD